MSASRFMSFYDHVTITPKTSIANHVKSDTCNHANEAVSFVITPLYSYSYPFLFYVPDEGCIPILFPFLVGIHHGVDFLAQFPSEFGQWVGDVVIIISHSRIAANICSFTFITYKCILRYLNNFRASGSSAPEASAARSSLKACVRLSFTTNLCLIGSASTSVNVAIIISFN